MKTIWTIRCKDLSLTCVLGKVRNFFLGSSARPGHAYFSKIDLQFLENDQTLRQFNSHK